MRGGMIAAMLLAWLCASGSAFAQGWPGRPVTIVVPFTPATGADIIARGLAPRLAERLGTNVVIDNRPGASGNIGTEYAARANADGLTLLVTAGVFVNNAAVNRNLRYDPIGSFAPIVLLSTGAQCLIVGRNSEARSVKELVAAAKARPGAMFYGSPGNGTPHHMAMELFKLEAGIDLVHVPYKGFGGAINDLIGGRVEAMILPLPAATPYTQNGLVRMLAVISPARSAVFPNVPTIAQEGYAQMQAWNWYAMLAPAGTPPEIVTRLNSDVNALLGDASVREVLGKQGFTAAGGPPERLASLMKAELERWIRVAVEAKIAAD
jgi:tripartite-type tricarboxylate transporter receptor subunit TctC